MTPVVTDRYRSSGTRYLCYRSNRKSATAASLVGTPPHSGNTGNAVTALFGSPPMEVLGDES